MMEGTGAWDRHDDGTYISIPIRYADLDGVRDWCAENCDGDFLIDLGRKVIFQNHDDAAHAAMWWRAEQE